MKSLTYNELAGVCNGLRRLAQHVYSTNTRLMFDCYQRIETYLERAATGENPDLICGELAKYLEEHFPELAEAAMQFAHGIAPASEV